MNNLNIISVGIISSFILLSLVHSSTGLKCHVCSSYEKEGCADPFVKEDGSVISNEFLQECPAANPQGEPYTICRKIYQNVRGDERVIRSCGYEEYKNECYKTVLEEYNTYVCQCKGDGCNPASYTQISMVAIISSVILSLFISQ